MVYIVPQPSDRGLDIAFKMALWDETVAADGLAFFLKDGSNANDVPGASGGALGYAPDGSRDGVSGGLLGIAFDKWGNFAAASSSCPGETGTPQPNSITIRGAGNGQSGYCRIASVGDGTFFTGSTRLGAARQVRIIVDPDTSADPKVSIYFGPVGALPATPTLQVDMPDELLAATTFKFGFGAASGWYKINAAVWDLSIEPSPDSVEPEPDNENSPAVSIDLFDDYELPGVPDTGRSMSGFARIAIILFVMGGIGLMIRPVALANSGKRLRGLQRERRQFCRPKRSGFDRE